MVLSKGKIEDSDNMVVIDTCMNLDKVIKVKFSILKNNKTKYIVECVGCVDTFVGKTAFMSSISSYTSKIDAEIRHILKMLGYTDNALDFSNVVHSCLVKCDMLNGSRNTHHKILGYDVCLIII